MAEHKASEMAYRSQVVSKTTHINEAFKDKWDEALTSLSQLDPKKVAKEYWHTTNKLSGKGKKNRRSLVLSLTKASRPRDTRI